MKQASEYGLKMTYKFDVTDGAGDNNKSVFAKEMKCNQNQLNKACFNSCFTSLNLSVKLFPCFTKQSHSVG